MESRAWGLENLDELPADAARATTGIAGGCVGSIWETWTITLSYRHLAGLTDFFRRLAQDGLVPDGSLSFISAA